MLSVTKIFRFETAHAIHGYNGHCKNIHGHSYVLHVTVSHAEEGGSYLPSPGFIYDFKELKQLVNKAVISRFDHQLILSEAYIRDHDTTMHFENLTVWKMEPTAENILLYIRDELGKELPKNIVLYRLKLYETNDSYAEWQKNA